MSSNKRIDKMTTPVSFFCWNIGINPHITSLSRDKVIPYLRSIDADIFCMQEFIGDDLPQMIGKERLRILRKNPRDNHWNDNVILTKFPVVSWGELDVSPQGYNHEWVLWATLRIGKRYLRVYNCHLEITGVGPSDRLKQIEIVYRHAAKAKLPCVICGDMNTTIPAAGFRRKIVQWVHKEPDSSMIINGRVWSAAEWLLFTKAAESRGFKDAIGFDVSTWALPHTSIELFSLKLDYFFTSGLSARVTRYGKYYSDHKPVFLDCTF